MNYWRHAKKPSKLSHLQGLASRWQVASVHLARKMRHNKET